MDSRAVAIRSRDGPEGPDVATFGAEIAAAYATKGDAIELGVAKLDDTPVPEAGVRLPLATMNRHGLIAGATGTGRDALCRSSPSSSAAGVAVFTADVKGDLSAWPSGSSGRPCEARGGARPSLRADRLPGRVPVARWHRPGFRWATVSDFGRFSLRRCSARMPQEQSRAGLPLRRREGPPALDLTDLRTLLTFLDSEGGREELRGIGGLSPQTVGVLLRSLVALETGGGNEFFGEPQLDVFDLLRTDATGEA